MRALASAALAAVLCAPASQVGGDLEARLNALVGASNGVAEIRTLAYSEDGARLPLLVIAEPPEGEGGVAEELRPGILVLGGSERHLRALERYASEDTPALHAQRRRCVVYALPSVGAEGLEAVRFERDFPVGWLPARLVDGAGDVPLARADSRALVRFLDARPNLAACVAPSPNAIDASGRAWEPFDLARASGRPGDFAQAARGLYVERNDLPDLQALAQALPSVAFALSGITRIAEEQWQVDLRLTNAGTLPTFSERAQALRAVEGLRVTVRGGALAAAAVRDGEDAFALTPARELEGVFTVWLQPIPAATQRDVRLILGAPAGAALELEAYGAWVPRLALAVALQP